MSDCLNCCWSSPENLAPPALQIINKKKKTPPISIPPSPSLPSTHLDSQHCTMIYIYYFFFKNKQKKEKLCAIWDDPASLSGVNGIYSVYFLHAVHINLHRRQYTTHIMFPGTITTSITLLVLFFFFFSYWTSPKRDVNVFRVLVRDFKYLKKIAYTGDLKLDWVAQSWLSLGGSQIAKKSQ